ncbi:MAG: energy transducer TonB [Rhodothalassiaceae bacterium]
MIARYASAFLIASGITLLLFFIMQALVVTDKVELSDIKTVRFVDVVQAPKQTQVKRETPEVQKPTPPKAPPPDLDVPTARASASGQSLNFGNLALNAQLSNVGPMLGAPTDGDYLPLVRIQPQYPRRAAERGIEGYVIVQLTVTPQGTTEDVKVIEADPPGYFERASIQAASKFKYKPKVVNGQPVKVEGVLYRFTFELEEGNGRGRR